VASRKILEAEGSTAELDLARWVVMQVAPEEQELFGVMSDAYQRHPERFTNAESGRDEMLGFGVEAAAALMTPVVLAAVAEVVRYLAGEVGGAIGVQSRLRRLLHRRSAKTPTRTDADPCDAALEPAQLTRVREIVLEKCRQAGSTEEKSQLLADGVVGALNRGR
jgi:hypothetical protein